MKKLLSVLLVIILIFSTIIVAYAAFEPEPLATSVYESATETGEESETPAPFTLTRANPNELKNLLADQDVVLAVTPGNLGIFEHHSPFVIPEGRTLYVQTVLNVQGNATLVIYGNVVVLQGGRINNQGGAGGTITIAAGGSLVNYGHVENVSNSTIYNYGTIVNNGRFEVRANTTLLKCSVSTIIGSNALNINRDANVVLYESVSNMLARAAVTAQSAIEYWDATTTWTVGTIAEQSAAALAAIDAALSEAQPAIEGVTIAWTTGPQRELGGVNIFDGPYLGGVMALTYGEQSHKFRVLLIGNTIEWNSYYWDNRNMFPEDGVPRSDMERNFYDLVERFGTSRPWASPTEYRYSRYIETEFLNMGFARENVEFLELNRRELRQNPDGTNLPLRAVPWIGVMNFYVPNAAPGFEIFSAYGQWAYGGASLPGNDVYVPADSWPFAPINDATIVYVGTYPILSLPPGTTGDIIVAVRHVEAINITGQLIPALDALTEENPDVNIQGITIARDGRVAWQRIIAGAAQRINQAASPLPLIAVSNYALNDIIDRGANLISYELIRRTVDRAVIATIPAETENPDMIIMISAHKDSFGLHSPGASDGASQTVVAMELARRFVQKATGPGGTIPGSNIEIHFATVGAHEGGNGTLSIELGNRLVKAGNRYISININMDMVISPSAMANGTLMDAVSMDTQMIGTGLPTGDAGLVYNLPAYLVIGSIQGLSDPVLAPGINNARVFRFGGSEHVRFAENPRLIEAASLIIVEDTTGGNNIATFYHNAHDNMYFEYCYTRLNMSLNLMINALNRAISQEVTRRANFSIDHEAGTLTLINAAQIYQTFDRVEGVVEIDGVATNFRFDYPAATINLELPSNANSVVVFRNMNASGYGVADHGNPARTVNHPHLQRFNSGMKGSLVAH